LSISSLVIDLYVLARSIPAIIDLGEIIRITLPLVQLTYYHSIGHLQS
jgi:hypothetical protein